MTRTQSIHVEILRIICITSMMWVHVAPGLGQLSFVNGGPAAAVGLFLGETMGRVSVTVLSFVSGYLFWSTGISRPFPGVVRRLFLSVYLPMLVWSAAFIGLLVAKEGILDIPSTLLGRIQPGLSGLVNAWAGISGPTANESLFFVRDLVAANLILRLAAPVVRVAPLAVFFLAFSLPFLPTEPLIFRPMVLSFVLFGAIAARYGITIWLLSSARVALPFGLGLSVLATCAHFLASRWGFPDTEAFGLIRRIAIGFLVLAAARALVPARPVQALARIGRHSFLAYLTHAILIGLVWTLWRQAGHDAAEPGYLILFLALPPACYAIASLAGTWLDRAAPLIQLCLRGRIYSVGEGRIPAE